MEQIIINHADGSKTPLFSRKNISAVSKATQKIALLSEDVVSITITTATPLDLMIGDTTLIYGKKYKLNQLPQITKNGERNYTYELTLEGAQYDLIDVQYHLPEDCYGDTFYSDLGGHLEVLMWNISWGTIPKIRSTQTLQPPKRIVWRHCRNTVPTTA